MELVSVSVSNSHHSKLNAKKQIQLSGVNMYLLEEAGTIWERGGCVVGSSTDIGVTFKIDLGCALSELLLCGVCSVLLL